MIRGSKVAIRPVKRTDLDRLLDLINDLDSAGQFLPSIWQSEAEFRSEFEKNGFLSEALSRFVMVDSDDQLVGLLWSFRSIPYFDAVEVGYRVFDVDNRGKGYASDALSLLCNYLFEASQVNRIEIRVAVENQVSQKVAEKCGFLLEGTHRQAAYSKGKLYDM
ncbi:MAG: GNAT family N-acetyltransferase, partial [Amphritea sp.]|nr:GNAT family N-acetyltransferase [Amphritea sp.]